MSAPSIDPSVDTPVHPERLRVATPLGTAHVIAAGSGPSLVLLHGHGGLAEEIFAPLAGLAARYRVVAIDRPGYGWSAPQPAARMGPDGQADWVAAVVDALGLGQPIVVGHSFGASIALWLAHAHPERVGGLVLVAPFCRPVEPPRKFLLSMASRQIAGWPLRWALPRVAPFIAGLRLEAAFDPNPIPDYMWRIPFHVAVQSDAVLAMAAELRGFNEAMTRLWGHEPVVTVPTVMVTGDADDLTTWETHCDWLARRLGCRSIRLPEVGHMPHHVRADAVAEAVDWVDGLRGRRRRLAAVRAVLAKAAAIRAPRRRKAPKVARPAVAAEVVIPGRGDAANPASS